ncbi:MAG: hypothetical protein D3919_09425 [Candidatus Electrothrix sp. AW5]|nr:hypothetical protein [Candidatus Electrothrix gigas]
MAVRAQELLCQSRILRCAGKRGEHGNRIHTELNIFNPAIQPTEISRCCLLSHDKQPDTADMMLLEQAHAAAILFRIDLLIKPL